MKVGTDKLLELVNQEEAVQLMRCLWKLATNPSLTLEEEESHIKIFERDSGRLIGEISETRRPFHYFCIVYVRDSKEPSPVMKAWFKAGLSAYFVKAFRG